MHYQTINAKTTSRKLILNLVFDCFLLQSSYLHVRGNYLRLWEVSGNFYCTHCNLLLVL